MSQQPTRPAESPTAFFSYARVDASIVRKFAEELRLTGVKVLLDTEFLMPGERFETVILEKVRSADALVFFVSPASLQSKWIEAELLAFSEASDKIIIPVLINGARFNDLPAWLARYYALNVDGESAIPDAARRVAEALTQEASSARPSEPEKLSPEAGRRGADLAASIAADIRAPARDLHSASKSVFLVHGHDLEFRDEAECFLKKLDVQPLILSRTKSRSRSLLDRFEALATQAIFAVVLMSPDDMGASREQYEAPEQRGGAQTLKYRARENVILELGFFYGRLGWDHVFVVRKRPKHPWPDFETPSDLAGTVFSGTSPDKAWRDELTEKLREAGLIEGE